MSLPKLSLLSRDGTHRLIPYRYSDRGRSALGRIAGSDGELNDLLELEGATSERVLGESGLLAGISLIELVSGFGLAHVVNASFTHTRPKGGRFHVAGRGAWYAAFALETSQAEVAFHRMAELREVQWKDEEISPYIDYLADFRAQFHDIRGDKKFSSCLKPDSYAESQPLGQRLLSSGSAGVVYPSVRHKGGTCIACFRPPLVLNVREGFMVTFRFSYPYSAPEIKIENS